MAGPEEVIRLRGGELRPARDFRPVRPDAAEPRDGWRLVQLDAPMTPARRRALEAAGARVGDYMTADTFLMDLSPVPAGTIEKLGFIKRSVAFRDSLKIDRDLGTVAWRSAERRALAARGQVAALVYLHPGVDVPGVAARLRQTPGLALRGRGTLGDAQVLGATLPRAGVAALARINAVRFIEEAVELESRSNTTTRWIVQSNVQGFTPFYDAGITGAGQIIGMLDEPFNAAHCAFADSVPFGPQHRKIVAYNTALGNRSHGTQVAGVLAGFNPASPMDNNTGVAFGAKLAFDEYPVPLDGPVIADRLATHMQQGAFIHNNSYGQNFLTAYNGLCASLDEFTWTNDDQLLVFAVSNASVIYNPENAKNPLAVTASDDTPFQSNHRIGGAGPTSDGRRKPDVMAPGRTQTSSGSTCGVSAVIQGTSYAAPAVAGVATLAREYFVRGFYPSGTPRDRDVFEPSGALLKAIIASAAQDGTDPGYPGNREGWGRIELDQTLYLPSVADAPRMIVREARNRTASALATGQSVSVLFRVKSSQRLRVSLAWFDAPAAVDATFAPVNDLDLLVQSPGASFLGNVIQGGVSVSGGDPDRLNNLEQVVLLGSTPGIWSASILAPAVQIGRQGYGLVISGDVEPCIAEFTGDGRIDFDDFTLFLSEFDAGIADVNDDGVTDFADFLAFFNALDAGC